MKIIKQRNSNLLALIIEIVLTVSICLGIAHNSYKDIHKQADNYAVEVENDYKTLTNDYIRSFQVIKMESEEKIKENLSFEQMQKWLWSRNDIYTDAIGEDVFDGFAFTYKGGYVHSWDYGDYSDYDPASRPWYQTAQRADGNVAVVAPYVTFLSNTDLIEDYDILRMSIVQKYNDDISFDFDLNVHEINALLAEKTTLYSGTFSVLYDDDGYILSSTDDQMYGHNINVNDKEISQDLSNAFSGQGKEKCGLKIGIVNGKIKMIYKYIDEDNKTLCMLIPFVEVFAKKFLFVLCLAVVLISIEIVYYIQNKIHMRYLEEANNAKSQFLSRMSHELRTPLNALTGYASLLRDDITSDNPDINMQLQNISYIDRASNYLLRIIGDILDIQNATFSKTQIKKEYVNAESYMQNIVKIIMQEAKEKNIDFSYKRLTKMSEEYLLDGVRFQQILLNVLHNAIKFTPAGGTVRMTAESIARDEKMSTIQFKISDTGIGMSKEFVSDRLFSNFAQENQSIDSPYEGCGIGMYISKELLELMDGKIECISEKGKGSTFIITITTEHVVGQRNRRARTANSQTYDLSGIRVLMCEDNPMNQDMEKRVLERMHCEVDIADDGQAGLDKFRDSEPGYYSVILMDIRMPNLDGWQTTRAIRAERREDASTIPILAVSANVFDDDIQTSIDSGINEHLSKPVDARILYKKIKEYCTVAD